MKTADRPAPGSRTESLEAIFRLSVLLTVALLLAGGLCIARDLQIQDRLASQLRAMPWVAQSAVPSAPRKD